MASRGNDLGEGTAEFRLLTTSDLPPAWLIPVSTGALDFAALQMGLPSGTVRAAVVVELPDFPWAWNYQVWAQSQQVPEALPTMVVSHTEFRGQEAAGRHAAASECLRSLLFSDKPAPFFARTFVPI